MKFDMHCHTKEGSTDGRVVIEEYIQRLRSMGFGGMMVTDHNSYDGYREWKNSLKGKEYTDFVVLKGIEYDTLDCGHMLVVMPVGVKLRILEMRGLPIALLVKIVHRYGGDHRAGPPLWGEISQRGYYQRAQAEIFQTGKQKAD